MCRLRLFYKCSDGEWGWAEWIIPYGEDVQAHIDHWRIGGRIVTHEYYPE